MKRIIPYVFALMIGVVLWMLVTPWAKAQRQDERLTGGECLIPVYCVVGTAAVRNRRKIAEDIRYIKYKKENDEK